VTAIIDIAISNNTVIVEISLVGIKRFTMYLLVMLILSKNYGNIHTQLIIVFIYESETFT